VDRNECPFCTLPKQRILLESETRVAFSDTFPVTEGHSLAIPMRQVASIFELSPAEFAALVLLQPELDANCQRVKPIAALDVVPGSPQECTKRARH
jgi:diadenosine tetraphosphate (Ap4A) HIT family hydrolase